MFASIVLAALVVGGIFGAPGLIPTDAAAIDSITERGIDVELHDGAEHRLPRGRRALVGLTLRRGARDPVCGMTVDRSTSFTSEWRGQTYYFCGAGCKGRFDADPELYLDPSRRPAHAHQH